VTRRPVELDDVLKIRYPHQPALSPDGRKVVFALGRLDHDANQWRANLWMLSTEGGTAVPFTGDEARDASPVWSPDGRWIAFLSNRAGVRRGRKRAPMQLWVIPVDGGEARQLTFFKAGVSDPAWSPDGQSLAFVTRGSLGERESPAAGDDELIVREVTRVKYKFDGMGYLDGFTHIWTVPAAGGEPRRLTDGDFDHEAPAWLLHGREIVFVANREPNHEFAMSRDVWAVDVAGGAMRRLTHHSGPAFAPAPSPDGRWIAYVGHDFHAKAATNNGVWVVPASGGVATNLTTAFDRSVGNAISSDARLGPMYPTPVWMSDSSAVIFYATDAGRTHLYRVGVANRAVRQLTDGAEVVADVTAAGGQIVYQRMGPATLDELWMLTPSGEPMRLARFNQELESAVNLAEPKRFSYVGADGWPMDGWVQVPLDFDPQRRYPAILRIHGGPHSAYGDIWTHYVALLAARGYVVVWTNPRGSQGYGEEFTRSVIEDWGTKDSIDITLGLDHVIAQGYVDPDRVAVTGGSYGGFMTNWLIGHTNRFRCALTEVPVSNLHSFFGTSDIGATWGEVQWGGTPWSDPHRLLAHSPLMFVHNVTTPVMITANEADHRCPVEQAEQYYIALRKLGREAVFLRFQDESHTMSTNGRPKPRIERLTRVLVWFDRHLQPAARAATGGRV
jgi:dipeptidyl aminopeptidase/acylaminoacyl peptidase